MANNLSFNHALESNHRKLVNKLIVHFEKELSIKNLEFSFAILSALLEEIYNYLRSSIEITAHFEQFTKSLFNAITKNEKKIKFTVTLASPTAEKELPYFLNFSKIFSDFDFTVSIDLFLISWENSYAFKSQEDFTQQLLQLKQTVKAEKFFVNIIPLHLPFLVSKDLFLENLNKKFYQYLIEDYTAYLNNSLDSSFNLDLAWIIPFYQRQHILLHFKETEIVRDLCIRRAIGKLSADLEKIYRDKSKNFIFCLLTSELNKRFIFCYRSKNPILNIKVKK